MTPRQTPRPLPVCAHPQRDGLTLVELLVAMSITLLVMAAVVTVFANLSGSVSRRRATIEMSSALRNVRETLARDLEGATCPAVPWQRPESNVGYLEIIEGPQNDYYPTPWLWDGDGDALPEPIGTVDGIDMTVSSLPGSNLRNPNTPDNEEGAGLAIGSNAVLPELVKTDGRGLGDADDVLMLTVRNENEPFVGRAPRPLATEAGHLTPNNSLFPAWRLQHVEVESPLAEVVWFAVENPVDPNRTFAFGEPGYRTIYRRALLILPELDYQIDVTAGGVDTNPGSVAGVLAGAGVVRVLEPEIGRSDLSQALASLIAFQDLYDLSVSLRWDSTLPDGTQDDPTDPPGRWVLKANTLADLTMRENRYEHHGYVGRPATYTSIDRRFPFAAISSGIVSDPRQTVTFVNDLQLSNATGKPGQQAEFQSVLDPTTNSTVIAYEPSDPDTLDANRAHDARPFALVNNVTDYPATARAILNEDGNVVHVTTGLAPLGGARRGDDIMMTDALAFDLRCYDPGAPVYGYYPAGDPAQQPDHLVSPGDASWTAVYQADAVADGVGYDPSVGVAQSPPVSPSYPFRFERQGAYTDLGYGRSFVDVLGTDAGKIQANQRFLPARLANFAAATGVNLVEPRFFYDGLIRSANMPAADAATPQSFTSRYATYDTWSWHYENNGYNEDADVDAAGRLMIDEGVNALDDRDPSIAGSPLAVDDAADVARFGPDDPAERETRPPYDTALRGLEVTLRTYERDSRQIREVRVRESFVPE